MQQEFSLMRKMGLEPTRAQCSQDPQSCSSASSDTSAYRISLGILFAFPSRRMIVYQMIFIQSIPFFNFFQKIFNLFFCLFLTAKNPASSQIQGSHSCGRWDLNPHKRNAYKILSLARLPVPTLPHIAFLWEFFLLFPRDE